MQPRAQLALFLLLLLLLSLPPPCVCHEARAPSLPNLLASSSSTSPHRLSLPISIHVGLLGLEGNGEQSVELSPGLLQSALSSSLPTLSPSSLHSQASLPIQYSITYRVTHLSHTPVQPLESLLSRAMRPIPPLTPSPTLSPTPSITPPTPPPPEVFEVQVSEVERWVESNLYQAGLAPPLHAGPHTDGDAHAAMSHFAVLIVNPSLPRMRPTSPASLPNATYRYHYRVGPSPPTQVWVGKDRFVYVDLSATAGGLTRVERGEGGGGTEWGMVPRAERVDAEMQGGEGGAREAGAGEEGGSREGARMNRASPLMVGRLSTLVIHAIEQVFLPDLAFHSLTPALPHQPTPSPSSSSDSDSPSYTSTPSLIIPLIVLRNHRRFHPFRPFRPPTPLSSPSSPPPPPPEVSIDVELLRVELSRLFAPTDVVVVPVLHELHEHHHLATSLWSSLREDTVHVRVEGGGFEAIALPYLSSSALLHSLGQIEDDLLSRMASSLPPSSGHRLYPVYIFSLLGLSPSLLIDRLTLYAATRKAAVVLQTGNDRVELPFVSDDGIATIDARSVTRHILAAVAVGAGGLVPPFMHVARTGGEGRGGGEGENEGVKMDSFTEGWSRGRVRHSYAFGVGAHPFGPFSASTTFSIIFLDHALRNAVLTRVTGAMRAIQRAVDALSTFYDDFAAEVDDDAAAAVNGTLYAVFSALTPAAPTSNSSPLHHHLRALVAPLTPLRVELSGVVGLLQSSTTLSAALAPASKLLTHARGYQRAVAHSVAVMRQSLQCCEKQWTVEGAVVDLEAGEGWLGYLELLLLVAVLAAAAYLTWLKLVRPASEGQRSAKKPNAYFGK